MMKPMGQCGVEEWIVHADIRAGLGEVKPRNLIRHWTDYANRVLIRRSTDEPAGILLSSVPLLRQRSSVLGRHEGEAYMICTGKEIRLMAERNERGMMPAGRGRVQAVPGQACIDRGYIFRLRVTSCKRTRPISFLGTTRIHRGPPKLSVRYTCSTCISTASSEPY